MYTFIYIIHVNDTYIYIHIMKGSWVGAIAGNIQQPAYINIKSIEPNDHLQHIAPYHDNLPAIQVRENEVNT